LFTVSLPFSVEPALATSLDEGGLGNTQLFGDAGEAPSLRTKEHEPLLFFDVGHRLLK